MDQPDALLAPVFDGVLIACGKIRLSHGEPVRVRATGTDYVVPGQTFVVQSSKGSFQFWLGMNAPRLLFYALAEGRPDLNVEQAFRYLSASAGTMSWDILCEPLGDGLVGLAATATAEPDLLLVTKAAFRAGEEAIADSYILTDRGRYWVHETALLVQGWLRSCERHSIRCGDQAPMPF